MTDGSPALKFTMIFKMLLSSVMLAGALAGGSVAGEVMDRVRASKTVRVCIWPDYYGVSYRNPRTHQLEGLDIDLANALGRDLGYKIDFVDSAFPTLVSDLVSNRCDVAMFAIAMLPARTKVLRFARPYLKSDIYAVATRSSAVVRQWSDIDKPGVLVGVQPGTFMEPVMAASLKHAQLVSVQPPLTRERELEAGRIDVFMTDYPYSRRLLDGADWATLIAPPTPFYVLPYGHAMKPGDDEWFSVIDEFDARVRKDGRLLEFAKRYGLGAIVGGD